MNTQLDALAYTNRLRHLPPAQKLGFAIAALIIALVSHPPVQIAIFCWLTVWIVCYAGIPARIYRAIMLGAGVFLMTSLPVLLINVSPIGGSSTDILFGFNVLNYRFYLSQLGLLQATEIFCRAIASTSCLFFIVLTIPFVELASTFRQFGCPSILMELLLLTYRFIFLLAEVAQRIILAQTARGGYRTRKLTINSASLLIRQLLQRTVERYHQLSLGVKARGFNHEFRFWHPQNYHYSQRYASEAIVGCTGLIGLETLYRMYG
jgi:cobalt/nickel transport system permease protein